MFLILDQLRTFEHPDQFTPTLALKNTIMDFIVERPPVLEAEYDGYVLLSWINYSENQLEMYFDDVDAALEFWPQFLEHQRSPGSYATEICIWAVANYYDRNVLISSPTNRPNSERIFANSQELSEVSKFFLSKNYNIDDRRKPKAQCEIRMEG